MHEHNGVILAVLLTAVKVTHKTNTKPTVLNLFLDLLEESSCKTINQLVKKVSNSQ